MDRIPRATSRARRRRIVALTLAALIGAGCASSESVKGLGEENRRDRLQIGEVARQTAELHVELKAVARELEAIRSEIAGARREGEGRQRATRESLDGLRARVEAAVAGLASVEAAVTGGEKRVAATESRLAGAETRVGSLAGSVRGIETSVRGLETTVGGLADHVTRLEASAAPAPNVTPPTLPTLDVAPPKTPRPSAPPLTAEQLFGRAVGNFRNGELGQAILDFEDFLAKHPGHALAGSAQFWIGEAYFAARDFQHAAVEYQKAVNLAPKGEKTPDAIFKLGLSFLSMKRPDRAREVWTQLIRDFPQSDAAQRARTTLREASPAPRP
jgi:tol-pal system protein YbgF